MFYYAPDLPEFYIKQCHILAKYIKQNYPNKNQNFFDQFIESPHEQYYSEFCSACGRGPAINENVPANNGKNKYTGAHTLFDGLIDLAKKENFQSLKVWEDYSSHWKNKTPQAFEKNYRTGATGIRSNPKFIMDYAAE